MKYFRHEIEFIYLDIYSFIYFTKKYKFKRLYIRTKCNKYFKSKILIFRPTFYREKSDV